MSADTTLADVRLRALERMEQAALKIRAAKALERLFQEGHVETTDGEVCAWSAVDDASASAFRLLYSWAAAIPVATPIQVRYDGETLSYQAKEVIGS